MEIDQLAAKLASLRDNPRVVLKDVANSIEVGATRGVQAGVGDEVRRDR